MKIILLKGFTGSGKSYLSNILSDKFNILSLSTGQILRSLAYFNEKSLSFVLYKKKILFYPRDVVLENNINEMNKKIYDEKIGLKALDIGQNSYIKNNVKILTLGIIQYLNLKNIIIDDRNYFLCKNEHMIIRCNYDCGKDSERKKREKGVFSFNRKDNCKKFKNCVEYRKESDIKNIIDKAKEFLNEG